MELKEYSIGKDTNVQSSNLDYPSDGSLWLPVSYSEMLHLDNYYSKAKVVIPCLTYVSHSE